MLLDAFKPRAMNQGWLWAGTDLSESTSVSEEHMATRLCADLSPITSSVILATEERRQAGFGAETETIQRTLGYQTLIDHYGRTPGLALDKLKAVLQYAWSALSQTQPVRGIVFAYDEAQNLADQPAKEQYPLSLLLDAFQSLQRMGLPLMLVLTGLPTLFPRLVEARTFSERMFRVRFLHSLNERESEDAVRKPVEDAACPVRLSDDSVQTIVETSGGYPYFLQFIWVRLFFVDGPRGFCQRHGKSYLTRRRRGGEGGGGGLLTGCAIPSAYRWAWCRWYSRVVEVPVRIEVAAGFVAPGASEPPRLQPSWPPGGSRPAHG